jgi:hypothetical protein
MKDWFSENVPEDIAKRIVRIRAEIGEDQVVDRDFRPDLAIDYETLEESLMTAPQTFAFWAMVYSEQKAYVAKLDRISKRRRAQIYDLIIEESQKKSVKVPEKILRELVEKDDKLLEIESKLILANRTLGKLFNIVDAMKLKVEALRSLAGFKRQEQSAP